MCESALVSCLCVTRNRVPFLRRAVSCFLSQTYQPRELVVLYESDDQATRDYLSTMSEPSIRGVEVPSSPRLLLGSLRNLSLRAGQGHYVAQWDDDDWHAPTRLTDQIGVIRRSGRPACVLLRWILYDATTQLAFVSGRRAWEGSVVTERTAVPAYADRSRGEDTLVIDTMLKESKLALLDRPQLYIYVFHGGNTWDWSHWQDRLLKFAQPLPREVSERVRQLLTPGGESEKDGHEHSPGASPTRRCT